MATALTVRPRFLATARHTLSALGRIARLGRRRRSVLVRVIVGGHEVDAFAVSTTRSLATTLGPVYRHLPARDSAVQLTGLEEELMPLGLRRAHAVAAGAGP